jgi:hypothetical protein
VERVLELSRGEIEDLEKENIRAKKMTAGRDVI